MNKASFWNKSLLYLFPIIIIFFFIQAIGGYTFFYFVYAPWVFAFYYFLIGIAAYNKIDKHTSLKILCLLWILYIIFSGLFADLPSHYFTEEIKRFIAPCFFIFVGMCQTDDRIYKVFIYSIFISVIIGFLLLLFQPAWYLNFLVVCFNNLWYSNASENIGSIMYTAFRFQSFFADSYAISYFVTFSFCIVVCDIYRKNRIVGNSKSLILLFLTFSIAIILSGFRVAMAYMLIVIIWMILYGIFTKNAKRRFFLYTLIAVITILSIILIFFSDNSYFLFIKESIFDRISDLSYENAMEGSRNTQQEKVLESWKDIWLGDGTGSKGAQARMDGLPAITDGGYIKMLVENGIVGFGLFIAIMLLTIKRGLKYLKYDMMELLIVGYTLVSMLGANSIAMSWSFVLMFWFSVGRIWNDRILAQRIRKKENI